MNNELLHKIRNFGALNYAPERMADLLGYTKEQRLELYRFLADERSEVTIAYRQGQAIGKYNIDAQLAKNAEKGDTQAAGLMQERRQTETVENLKKELFGIV
jgi:hypothetical protein